METLREGDGCAISITPLAPPPLAGDEGADAGPLPPVRSGRVRAIRAAAAASAAGVEVEGTWLRILWSGTCPVLETRLARLPVATSSAEDGRVGTEGRLNDGPSDAAASISACKLKLRLNAVPPNPPPPLPDDRRTELEGAVAVAEAEAREARSCAVFDSGDEREECVGEEDPRMLLAAALL